MDLTKDELSTNSSSPSLLVHVVSPSNEVPDRLTFQDVPVTSTIADIKRRIQDAVSTKPEPERQRLIYRGRALVQQDQTLATLFGNDVVRMFSRLRCVSSDTL